MCPKANATKESVHQSKSLSNDNSCLEEVTWFKFLGEAKTMWFVFGIVAIVSAIMNIAWALAGRDPKWFRFISLSATALTLCGFYSNNARWVINEDWSALMDVVPAMTTGLWRLTTLSIIINGVTMFRETER